MEEKQPTPGAGNVRRVAWLAGEVRDWQRAGLVTPDQGRLIMARYGDAAGGTAHHAQARFTTVLAVFGATLVALGVILFFAANWTSLPTVFRLALAIILPPAIYAVGYRLRYVKGYRRVGTGVLLLGAVTYGAALHLVAQAYNFPLHDPWLFTLFFLGILPLAYLTRSQSITVLTVAVFLATVGFWVADRIGASENEEAAVVFTMALYVMLALSLYGLGRVQDLWTNLRPLAAVYRRMAVLTLLAFLYVLSFVDIYGKFEPGDPMAANDSLGLWILFYAVAALALLATALAQWRTRRPGEVRREHSIEGLVVFIMFAAAVAVVHAPHVEYLFPLLFNLLFFLTALGLIFYGYHRNRELLVNLGLAFFTLGVITRYFELSWDLLDRAAVFALAGLILLALGYFMERSRRRMLQQMAVRQAATPPMGGGDDEL